jgi:hypothetical protein
MAACRRPAGGVPEARRSKPIKPMRSEASHAERVWLPCLASSNARRTAVAGQEETQQPLHP